MSEKSCNVTAASMMVEYNNYLDLELSLKTDDTKLLSSNIVLLLPFKLSNK